MSAELRIPAVVVFDLDDIRAAYDQLVKDYAAEGATLTETFEEFRDVCVAEAFIQYAEGWKVERA